MEFDEYDEKYGYSGGGPEEEEYQYDPRTGQYVKGLAEFKDFSRLQKEGRRRRLYLGTTVVGGKIGEIMQRIEKKVFKTANVGEIYDNDIDLIIEEIESENKLPNFEIISKEILNYDLKVIPFVYYTNPKLLLLALYYRKFGKIKNSNEMFSLNEYMRENLISKWDICRYSIYLDKILDRQIFKGPVLPDTPKVNNFLDIYRSDKIKETRIKDRSSLSENYPDIFISGYPRFCQYQPSMIKESKRDDYKNFLEFPEGSYLACEHKKYPYIGMKENYLENNEEYPLLPCCYTKPTDVKEEISTVDPNKPVGNKTIYSINNIPRFAFLPNDILLLFKLIDIDTFQQDLVYLRQSVERSPISSLLCMNTIFPDTSISRAKRYIKQLVHSNYGSSTFINSTNIDYIIDNENFLDATQFIPIYEKIFNCNIILFCITNDNPDGSMCSQKFRIKIFNEIDMDKPFVFLFESMGSIVDKYKYPQYEYIVRGKITKNKVTRIVDDIYIAQDKDKRMLKNLVEVYKSMYPIEKFDLDFKNNIVYQKYDYNGFIRMLLFENGISCLVDPIQNMSINYKDLTENFDINSSNHTYDNIIKFMKEERMKRIEKYMINNKVYGLVGYKKINKTRAIKIYIPICVDTSNIDSDIPEYSLEKNSICPKNLLCSSIDKANDEKQSYIQKYIYLSQVSRCLTAYTIYIFSNIVKNNAEVSINNYESIKNLITDKFSVVPDFFNKQISLSRNISLNSILIENDKIKVPSLECKDRLIYSLITKYQQDPAFVLNYYTNKYIPDFYVDIRDFNIDISFLLLNNSSLLLFYNYTTPNYDLNYNLIDEDIFYIQNPQIEDNEKLFVVRSTTFEQAFNVCYNWDRYYINSNDDIDDVDIEDYNIKLYSFSDVDIDSKMIVKNNDETYYTIGIAKTDKQTYFYSFLIL
jgi:hypothetical protein